MPTRSHHRPAYSYVTKTGKTVHVKAHHVTYHSKERHEAAPKRKYTRRAAGRPVKGPEFYEKYPRYIKGHKHKVFPANYSVFN